MNISEEALFALNAKIEESNDTFLNASKATKRMMLAQDVLDRIELGQLKPERTGSTVRMIEENHFVGDNFQFDEVFSAYKDQKDVSIKETLQNPTVQCEVCAKGGMFLALIGRVNDFTWKHFSPYTNHDLPPQQKLLEIFSEKMLAAIEAAFEGSTHVDVYLNGGFLMWDLSDHTYFRNFYEAHYGSPTNRLKAICTNIIQNEGSFIIDGCTFE
jgi:hypothetical protein